MIEYRICYPQLAAALNLSKDRVLIHRIHRDNFIHRDNGALNDLGIISINREDFDLGLAKGLFNDIPKIPITDTARIKVYNKIYDKLELESEPMYSDKILVSAVDSARFESFFSGKLWMEELGLKLVRRSEYESKYTVSGLLVYTNTEWSNPAITFGGMKLEDIKPQAISVPKVVREGLVVNNDGAMTMNLSVHVPQSTIDSIKKMAHSMKEWDKAFQLATQGWYLDKESNILYLNTRCLAESLYTVKGLNGQLVFEKSRAN